MGNIEHTSIPGRGLDIRRRLDRYLGIPTVAVLGAVRGKREMPPEPRSFGLLNTAAIGDTVLMSGPVADLRSAHPNASITLFSGPSNYEAARLIPDVDSIVLLPIPRVRLAIGVIRQYELDILLDFGPWPRLNALLTLLARATYTVGFQTPGEYRHYGYDHAVEHSAQVHELENHRRIVGALGVATGRRPSLRQIPLQNPPLDSDNYVVLHLWPGGSRAELKEWPRDRWIELARELASRGYIVTLTGAAGQSEANRSVISRVSEPHRRNMLNAAGLSLAETSALLNRARLVVSVDTGVMHLAAAFGVPLVALHGPTSPHRWGPVSANCKVVESPVNESGYLNLGFELPRRPPECMKAITYDAVWQACQASLRAPQAARRDVT